MTFDAATLIAFLLVFVRCSAMLLSSPFFGPAVPIPVRVLFGAVVSAALVPVAQPLIGPVPLDLVGLGLVVGREALIGLLMGGLLQMLLVGVQMAGTFLDLQIGIGTAQLFNPVTGVSASPIAQFKYMLGLVLLFLLNGHHLMFQAFVRSYAAPAPTMESLPALLAGVTSLIGYLSLMALQIGAPVAAVSVIIDVAAGIVNKAVPQTVPFLLSLPAKIMVGVFVLSLGLPALVVAVQNGLDFTFTTLARMLGLG